MEIFQSNQKSYLKYNNMLRERKMKRTLWQVRLGQFQKRTSHAFIHHQQASLQVAVQNWQGLVFIILLDKKIFVGGYFSGNNHRDKRCLYRIDDKIQIVLDEEAVNWCGIQETVLISQMLPLTIVLAPNICTLALKSFLLQNLNINQVNKIQLINFSQ